MPATESSNALLLPLTGHELGHSVWTNENLEDKWAADVERKIRDYLIRNKASFYDAFPAYAGVTIDEQEFSTNMFLKLTVDDISPLTLAQMEETFCDAIGLKIFGDSFVQAFHCLLAPGFGGHYSTRRCRPEPSSWLFTADSILLVWATRIFHQSFRNDSQI
jgi:hypothetical protein